MLLESLFYKSRGFITIWSKQGASSHTEWFDLSKGDVAIRAAQEAARRADARGADVYVSTCPAARRGAAGSGGRIKQEDVHCIPAFFLDVDTQQDDVKRGRKVPEDAGRAIRALAGLDCPPTLCVNSGHGVHAYWILEDPIPTPGGAKGSEAAVLLRRFADAVAGATGYTDLDTHASEPSRVLRVDGTHNHKGGACLPVEAVEDQAGPVYRLEELRAFAERHPLNAADKNICYAEAATGAQEERRTEAAPNPLKNEHNRRPSEPPAAAAGSAAGLRTVDELLGAAGRAANAEQFNTLWRGSWAGAYGSQSEADLALCNMLAFYTGGDAALMDEAFRKSGLMRAKWDERHGPDTYGALTITRAIADTRSAYSGKRPAPPVPEGLEDGGVFERYAALYAQAGGMYRSEHGCTQAVRLVKDGGEEVTILADFTCAPLEEIERDDGAKRALEFRIAGVNQRGQELPEITVPSSKFNSLNWVTEEWGCRACIKAGSTNKDKLREAIQRVGGVNATRRTVYAHTGWRTIGGQLCYLYHGGAVGAQGVSVELEGNLAAYSFPPSASDPVEAVRASRDIGRFLPPRIGVPLLAHMHLAPLRHFLDQAGIPPAHVLFLSGHTGARKSTVAALGMAHFGSGFSAKRPPASFADTANATRRKAFLLKDAPLLVDDFHPVGDPVRRRAMSGAAQELARAWGDLAERGRMRSDLTVSAAQPPRGLGMMTGEDLPDVGESGVARYYLVDVKPDDVPVSEQLSDLQQKARQGLPAQAMRGFIEWLRPRADELPKWLGKLFEVYRRRASEQLAGAVHGRLVEAVAHLATAYEVMLCYWEELGALEEEERRALLESAWGALMENVTAQQGGMSGENPVDMFLDALRELLTTGAVVLRDLNDLPLGGCEGLCGFQDSQFVYLLPTSTFAAVQQHFRNQGGAFPISRAVLWKRLAERGLIQTFGNANTCVKRIAGNSQRVILLRRDALWPHAVA